MRPPLRRARPRLPGEPAFVRPASPLAAGRACDTNKKVLRILVIVGLSLATAQTLGVALVLGAHGCQERCADDLDDGECAPGCHDCSCCQGVRLTTPGEQVACAPLAPGRTLHPSSTVRLSSAEPREILHVPKPLAV